MSDRAQEKEMHSKMPTQWYSECFDTRTALDEEQMLWCIAAGAAALNNQHAVEYCTHRTLEKAYNLAALYEALLQTYLFAGFPAALEALSSMNKVIRHHDISFSPPLVEEYNVALFRQRGEQLCATIYTTVYESMRQRLQRSMPHLDEWMVIEGYGKTLSRPILNTKQRELITVTILSCSGWERQLFSHIRGAFTVGATQAECEDALRCALYLGGESPYTAARNVLQNVLQSRV